MTRLASILTCVALAGCSAAPTQESQAGEIGAAITLAPGATATVNSAQLKVRFIAVTEDSRCPRDVACVWAGEVKVKFEIHEASQVASQVEILEGGNAVVGKYQVTLVRVEPQPTSTARIAPQEYLATVKIGDVGP